MEKVNKYLTVVLITVLTSLGGCAIPLDDSDYQWKLTSSPKPSEWVLTNQKEVNEYCQDVPNRPQHIVACAVRFESTCKIFTSHARLPESVIRHEEKHCQGWDHQ